MFSTTNLLLLQPSQPTKIPGRECLSQRERAIDQLPTTTNDIPQHSVSSYQVVSTPHNILLFLKVLPLGELCTSRHLGINVPTNPMQRGRVSKCSSTSAVWHPPVFRITLPFNSGYHLASVAIKSGNLSARSPMIQFQEL